MTARSRPSGLRWAETTTFVSSTTLGISRAFFFSVGGDLAVDLSHRELVRTFLLRLFAYHFQHFRFWSEGAEVGLQADKHARNFAGLADDKTGLLSVRFADELVELCRCLGG